MHKKQNYLFQSLILFDLTTPDCNQRQIRDIGAFKSSLKIFLFKEHFDTLWINLLIYAK